MNVGLSDLPKKSNLRKTVLFRKFKSLSFHKTKTKKTKKVRRIFYRFFFTFSEKNILVGHILSLCPINGKRQIFHKFFFWIGLWPWPLSYLWTKCRPYINFLKEHFIIYPLIYKLIINFKKMYNLFALKNSKILKKMLKIAKSKKLWWSVNTERSIFV